MLVSLVTVLLGVWLMDLLVPAYDPGTRITYAGSPFTHIAHMLSYAAQLKAVPNATGISSTPWQWLIDQVPIDYARVAVNSIAGGKTIASKALFAAKGEINLFVILVTMPALAGGDRRPLGGSATASPRCPRRLVRRYVHPLRDPGLASLTGLPTSTTCCW